jgi:hypothetical protein
MNVFDAAMKQAPSMIDFWLFSMIPPEMRIIPAPKVNVITIRQSHADIINSFICI